MAALQMDFKIAPPGGLGPRPRALGSQRVSWAVSPTGLVWPAACERPKAYAVVGPCGALVRSLACQFAGHEVNKRLKYGGSM